jgi:hypothetical protein
MSVALPAVVDRQPAHPPLSLTVTATSVRPLNVRDGTLQPRRSQAIEMRPVRPHPPQVLDPAGSSTALPRQLRRSCINGTFSDRLR